MDRQGGADRQPTFRPTEYRCLHKGDFPICAAGADYPIADNVLRLPDNSPFWQHFTQGLLLCSWISYTICDKK